MKELLKIAWPLIIANAFWNIQLTIDRLFLAQYSTEALGASMTVMAVFWVPMALLQQTVAYSMTFTAQYKGANSKTKIGPIIWQALFIAILGGLLFLNLIFFSETLFSWMGHSKKLQNLESTYFSVLCLSALPTALLAAISGFFSGLGKSSTVMWLNGIGMLFNILFDYLIIPGNWGFPQLGIAGAAYATSLSSLIAALCALALFLRQKNEAKYHARSGFKIDLNILKRFLRFGLPSGLQWALEGLAFTFFLILVGKMENGEAALAASSIAVTVMMLAILPTLGIAQGASILVGQYLGKNDSQQASRYTWKAFQVASVYMLLIGLSFALFPNFYLSLFENMENPQLWLQVQAWASTLLLFVAGFIFFDSMNIVFSFTLKGAGDTRFVSIIALLLPWPIMILPTYLLLGNSRALYLAWFCASLFIVTQALIFFFRFLGGRWKKMRVIQ